MRRYGEMRVKYEAFDGKLFLYEDDCREYEKLNLDKLEKEFKKNVTEIATEIDLFYRVLLSTDEYSTIYTCKVNDYSRRVINDYILLKYNVEDFIKCAYLGEIVAFSLFEDSGCNNKVRLIGTREGMIFELNAILDTIFGKYHDVVITNNTKVTIKNKGDE